MFDLGWSELMMVAVITVIVVGPRELPRVLRTVMQATKKLRSMAGEFQSSIDEMAREADLHDLKKDLENSSKSDWEKKISDTIDPTGEVGSILDETKQDLDEEKRNLDVASEPVQFSARDALSSNKPEEVTEEAVSTPAASETPASAASDGSVASDAKTETNSSEQPAKSTASGGEA